SLTMPVSTPSSFTLSLSFRSAEHDEPIAFKVDGSRFEGGSRTLKFAIDSKYKVTVETKPPVEFHHLHIGGSDLAISGEGITTGKYGADWNTTGITPTKRGARENIGLNLQGPGGVLRSKLQCKFYKKEDSHATWGHKMNALQWVCSIDGAGNISLGEENVK
ncbi:hypothetical protein PFISCL1PPCAC_2030, partial [Pristionchus fissidentatus]